MRTYKATRTVNTDELSKIYDRIKTYTGLTGIMESLSIYLKNVNPANIPEEKELIAAIEQSNVDKNVAKNEMEDYNSNPLLKFIGLKKIDLMDKYYIEQIKHIATTLDVSVKDVCIFLLQTPINKNNDFFWNLDGVMREQEGVLEELLKKGRHDTYYLEILVNDERVISMLVTNLENTDAQLHYFIVKDLKHLISPKSQLGSASLFMHSFASSLFGKKSWYTEPRGNMLGIVSHHMKEYDSWSIPNRVNPKITKQVTDLKNNVYFAIPNATYKIEINNFMRNLWKTERVLPHTSEETKEQLGKIFNADQSGNDMQKVFTVDFTKTGGKITGFPVYVIVIFCIILLLFLFKYFAEQTEYYPPVRLVFQ